MFGPDVSPYRVYMGSVSIDPSRQRGFNVEKIVVHQDMKFTEPWAHDIALVKMVEPLVYDSLV